MRPQVNREWAQTTLARVLQALESEILEATDEEILEAAQDLGMDLSMRGSAAFLGLKYPVIRRRADFFGDRPESEDPLAQPPRGARQPKEPRGKE
jgi:hypothetical protein